MSQGNQPRGAIVELIDEQGGDMLVPTRVRVNGVDVGLMAAGPILPTLPTSASPVAITLHLLPREVRIVKAELSDGSTFETVDTYRTALATAMKRIEELESLPSVRAAYRHHIDEHGAAEEASLEELARADEAVVAVKAPTTTITFSPSVRPGHEWCHLDENGERYRAALLAWVDDPDESAVS